MARLKAPAQRQPAPSAAVPSEFLDHAADVWCDEALFREFMQSQGLVVRGAGPAIEHMRPEDRLEMAVNAWAKRHDLMRSFNPSHPEMGAMTDWQRLRDFGIRRPRRLRLLVVD